MYIVIGLISIATQEQTKNHIINSYYKLRGKAMHDTLVSTCINILCLQADFPFANGYLVTNKFD